MQCSAEVLSRAGFRQSSDTNETVRKMAAMKTESVHVFCFTGFSVIGYFCCKMNALCFRLTRHRLRLDTLKLLLERGADPNISRVPMPVIFLAIIAADVEAVRRLLLCGARTDIPLPPEVGQCLFKFFHFHASTHRLLCSESQGFGGASCHRIKAGVHFGQVDSSLLGHVQRQTIHTRSLLYS